ncbi:MAG: glycosyltransferase family 87 protein [Planctomycetota bacterium]
MDSTQLQAEGQHPNHRAILMVLGVLCILALSMLAYRGMYRGFVSGSDFGLYYCSTVAMVKTGDPYSPEPLRELAEECGAPTNVIENAIAPPICYTPLLPYAALPWPAARVLWACTNVLGVAALWYWLMGLARIPRIRLSPQWLGMTLLVAGFAPLQTNIAFGQLAVLASAGIIGSIALAQQGKTRTAACLYVLAGLLKPQIAIAFVLYWLYKREWRLISYTASIGLVITLLTFGWLHVKNPIWFEAFQANLQRLTQDGGASDYTRRDSYIFSDLRVPLYAMFQSKPIAAGLAWAITILLALLAYPSLKQSGESHANTQPDQPLQDLRAASVVACLGMLPIYHVYYDTTILLLAGAWAIALLLRVRTWQAIAALLLLTPMLVPGQPILNTLKQRDILPGWLVDSNLYQWFVLLHLPWLIIAISVCMISYNRPNSSTASDLERV